MTDYARVRYETPGGGRSSVQIEPTYSVGSAGQLLATAVDGNRRLTIGPATAYVIEDPAPEGKL